MTRSASPGERASGQTPARAVAQPSSYDGLRAQVGPHLANPPSPGMAGPLLAWLAVHEPDAPVAAGAAAAFEGSGLMDPGTVQLTLGTGGHVIRPVTSLPTELPSAPVTHLYRAATDKGWYARGAGLNGGSTLAWVAHPLGASWTEPYAAAVGQPRLDDPYFRPRLHGERTPYLDPGMRGAWIRLAPDHDQQALLRAALEGVAFSVRDACGRARHAGQPGAAPAAGRRRHDRPRMVSDVGRRPGLPLVATDVSAVSGWGPAILAACAVELTGPGNPVGLVHADHTSGRRTGPRPTSDLSRTVSPFPRDGPSNPRVRFAGSSHDAIH